MIAHKLFPLFVFLLVLCPGVLAQTYYYAGGSLLATADEDGLSYRYRDRLGSDIQTVELPFGQIVDEEVRFSFTGKELDKSNLHYFGARYYDSEIGRFTGIDPVEAAFPYSYVHNNPINKVDPTGLANRDGLAHLNQQRAERESAPDYIYSTWFEESEQGYSKFGRTNAGDIVDLGAGGNAMHVSIIEDPIFLALAGGFMARAAGAGALGVTEGALSEASGVGIRPSELTDAAKFLMRKSRNSEARTFIQGVMGDDFSSGPLWTQETSFLLDGKPRSEMFKLFAGKVDFNSRVPSGRGLLKISVKHGIADGNGLPFVKKVDGNIFLMSTEEISATIRNSLRANDVDVVIQASKFHNHKYDILIPSHNMQLFANKDTGYIITAFQVNSGRLPGFSVEETAKLANGQYSIIDDMLMLD